MDFQGILHICEQQSIANYAFILTTRAFFYPSRSLLQCQRNDNSTSCTTKWVIAEAMVVDKLVWWQERRSGSWASAENGKEINRNADSH